ncbi:hypothetical protein DPMN_055527 [Dreissena polymorpha]|uniref:Uncharacterized protein n=1 Tax=Dreissena polymorpha TaxID=45954 RepID=A0A9D4CRJ5_DREPO|nr:hypothetical protein DPMN_055527 [Dreissena polymorpha]
MFHEDFTTNMTSRVLKLFICSHKMKTSPPLSVNVFLTNRNRFGTQLRYHKNKLLIRKTAQPPGGHNRNINMTFEVLTRKTAPTLADMKTAPPPGDMKAAPPPGGHFHEDLTKNRKLPRPPGGHVFSPILTIFKLVRNINNIKVLTKFHEKTAPPPWWPCFSPFLNSTNILIKTNILTKLHEDWASNVTSTVFELGRGFIGINVLTKFHEDRTRNVASRVFTRQNVEKRTTDDGRRAKGYSKSSP